MTYTTLSINKYLKLGNITIDLSLQDEPVDIKNVSIPTIQNCYYCPRSGGSILTVAPHTNNIDESNRIHFSHFMCLMQDEFSKMTEENKIALKRLLEPYLKEEPPHAN